MPVVLMEVWLLCPGLLLALGKTALRSPTGTANDNFDVATRTFDFHLQALRFPAARVTEERCCFTFDFSAGKTNHVSSGTKLVDSLL